MKEQLEALRAAALKEIAESGDLAALEAARVKFLGKKGEITAILKQMGRLSPEERPVMGQLANTVRAAVEEGIVPGGGVALLNVMNKVQHEVTKYQGDAKTGVQIILRAMEEPMRQIALNAGIDGSVIIDNIRRSRKQGYGYDALKGEYVDMIERGIIDPTKVTRSALQNAASVAAMVLTTESLVTDIPEPPAPAPAGNPDMGGMY